MNTFDYNNEYWKVQVPGRGLPGLQSSVVGLKEKPSDNENKQNKQERK